MPKFGSYTELTTLADADTVLVKDASAGLTKYITATNFAAYVANETVDLDGISDVAITALGAGEVLWTSDGSTWINGTLAEADIAAASRTVTIAVGSASLTTSAGAQDLTANRTWTLDTAQDIQATASPTFVGLTLSADLVTTSTIDGVDIASFKSAYDTHAASDGSDHTFLDQSVVSGASPTFTGTNISGVSGITGTGALNSGSITSGFGSIDIGSSTFDTTGAVSTGALTASAGAGHLTVSSTSTASLKLIQTFSGTQDYVIQNVGSSDSLRIYDVTAGAERLTLTTSGNFSFNSGDISGVGTLTATTLAGTLSTATQNSVTTMTGLTTVGTLVAGAVPASLVTAGTFGTGDYTIVGDLTIGGEGAYTGKLKVPWGAAAPTYYFDFGYNSDGNKVFLRIADGGAPVDVMTVLYTGAVTFAGTVSGITTLTATTLNGTLGTAAQPNVTSVGTLTGLTVSGAIADASDLEFDAGTGAYVFKSPDDTTGLQILAQDDNDAFILIGASAAVKWTAGSTVAEFQSSISVDSDLTLASGSITSASGAIDFGNENLTTTGAISGGAGSGFGIAPTDGTLHVHTASAGAVTASTSADDLVVENSAAGGISILTPAASFATLALGSPTDAIGAKFTWSHSSNYCGIGTDVVGAETRLFGDDGIVNLTLSGASGSELATFAGDVTLSAGRLLLTDANAAGVTTANLTNTNATGYGLLVTAGTGATYYAQSWRDKDSTNLMRLTGEGNLLLGSQTSTSNNAQLYATKTYSAASGNDQGFKTNYVQSVATTGEFSSAVIGGSASHTSGTVGAVLGIVPTVVVSGAGGTTTSAYAGRFAVQNTNATATITNAYGVYVSAFTATGTITNRWGIYQAGASEKNHLNGATYIGTTSGTGKLRVVDGSGELYFQDVSQDNLYLSGTNATLNIDSISGNFPGLFLKVSGTETGQLSANSTTFLKLQAAGYLNFSAGGNTERMRLTSAGPLLLGGTTAPTTADEGTLALFTNTAPTAVAANSIALYSSDLSAGNTIPSIWTEGTGIYSAGTPAAATGSIAIRVNGTVYHLTASTTAAS